MTATDEARIRAKLSEIDERWWGVHTSHDLATGRVGYGSAHLHAGEDIGYLWPEDNKARWELTIRLHELPHTRDASNCIKAIEDLIVAHTGLSDAYCDVVQASRCRGWPGGKRAEVIVRVTGWLIEGVLR